MRAAAALLGAGIEAFPEGKTIERIDVVRLDPIEDRDPLPAAFDVVHTTTKEDVVRHEMLLHVGEPYRAVLADESARNLRAFAQVSVVIVAALEGSGPDRVRVVVITKDVWSLLPNFDFSVTSGGLESLLLELEETNLAGRQQSLIGRMLLQPESLAVGLAYGSSRFTGRWLTFLADGNVIFNRRSGDPEGTFGAARIERTLYTTRTDWAWLVGVAWRDEVYRRYSNAEVARWDDGTPWVYRSRKIEDTASITRSFGWARKHAFTFGGVFVRDDYRPDVPDLAFERAVVPVGEARVYPFVEWHAFANDFLRIVDYESLALQEDVRVGHDVVVRAYPVLRAFGSSRDLAGLRAAAAYTVRLGDGFVRGLVDATNEAQADNIPDASITGDLRVVSPRTPAGRMVFDTTITNRWRNYLNRTSVLGGEDRLRGYPTRYLTGKDVTAVNLEYRSRPVEIASCQLGGALFYDAGQVGTRAAHSVGLGFRLVLPQIDRAVLRGDLGFPMTDNLPPSFFLTFGQAFKAAAGIPPPLGP